MTANATQRSIKSFMKKIDRSEKLNILTLATHERYEENLCKTGHNFYSLKYGKEWDTTYSQVPQNYHIINSIPDDVDIDLLLTHTSCERLQVAHNFLSETNGNGLEKLSVPILSHCHILPDIRMDVNNQINIFNKIPVDKRSFISKFNMKAWGADESKSCVIEHGVDTEFWNVGNKERDNPCLSVVNDWPNRDWCCGYNLWQQTVQGLPVKVFGKSPGFSEPAESTEHLRDIYQSSRIFYNTSLHSPVPTVLLEAMACGCAIVSTATCMIPGIIKNGENGLISNDPRELRAYLELLINNEQMAKRLGENARKTIEEKYNLDIFVKKWDNLLYNTVENHFT